MTTSNPTPDTGVTSSRGGFIADILTLARLLLTPIIMFIIITGNWPDIGTALKASMLFVIAALTDIFDDYFGGTEIAPERKFGWFDDIADIILVIGTLIALAIVVERTGAMNWFIAIPIALFVGKELIVGLVKGFELSNLNPVEDGLAVAKNALSMLATAILVGSPWLTSWYDSFRAGDDPYAVYNEASPLIWNIGTAILWLAALVGILHAFRVFQATANRD